MSYEIKEYKNIDKNNIKIGKTFKYSLGDNYYLTNLYYINQVEEMLLDRLDLQF